MTAKFAAPAGTSPTRIAGTMPDSHSAVNTAATTIRNHPARSSRCGSRHPAYHSAEAVRDGLLALLACRWFLSACPAEIVADHLGEIRGRVAVPSEDPAARFIGLRK